jgi:hypothetical protein
VTLPDPGVLSMVSAGDRVDLWGPDGPVARAVVVLRVDTVQSADVGVIPGSRTSASQALESGGLIVSAGQEVASAILAVPEDAMGRSQVELVLRHPWPEAG